MFGEYDNKDYDIEYFDADTKKTVKQTIVIPVLFFSATAILPLILLNLVIAIMSDTYEKVITSIGDSDNKQLNAIIIQYENW